MKWKQSSDGIRDILKRGLDICLLTLHLISKKSTSKPGVIRKENSLRNSWILVKGSILILEVFVINDQNTYELPCIIFHKTTTKQKSIHIPLSGRVWYTSIHWIPIFHDFCWSCRNKTCTAKVTYVKYHWNGIFPCTAKLITWRENISPVYCILNKWQCHSFCKQCHLADTSSFQL